MEVYSIIHDDFIIVLGLLALCICGGGGGGLWLVRRVLNLQSNPRRDSLAIRGDPGLMVGT